MDNEACCYLITNTVNGLQYIGVTTDFDRRMSEHKNKGNERMRPDIEKYGWEAFKKEVLLVGTERYCYTAEPLLIKEYDSYYNIAEGGFGGNAPKGEDSPAAKITEIDVVEIRRLYSKGGVSLDILAAKYDICKQQISRIVRGERDGRQPQVQLLKGRTEVKIVYPLSLRRKMW